MGMHEDDRLSALATLGWRTALCAVLSVLTWKKLGVESIAVTAPLFGIAVARPLMEAVADGVRAVRARALAEMEGTHHVYRGVHVRVVEDASHHCWVRAADVRRIIGSTDTDNALALTHGEGYQEMGRPPQCYLSEGALLTYLSHHGNPAALKLRQWVERAVVWPARARRRRSGHTAADSLPMRQR